MNPIEVLCLIWAEGITIERRGDEIVCVGKARDDVHPALLALIREHKPTLLRVMTDRSPSPSARG